MPDTDVTLPSKVEQHLPVQINLLDNPSPSVALQESKSAMPWFQPTPWYQQLARFMGLSDTQCMTLRSGQTAEISASWQLALYCSNDKKQINSLSNYYSPALGPLAPTHPADWQQFFAAVTQTHSAVQRLQLQPLTTTQQQQLQQLTVPGWGFYFSHCSDNWTARTENYWQQRPSQLRNTIRRKRQKLTAEGARIDISQQATPELVAAYWQVYQHSWKPAEPNTDFINALLDQTSQHQSLRLGVLWLDGRPIAAQCWLVAAGVAAIYKLAQDQSFDHYSPGTVLTAALLDHVIEVDQVHTIDFLTGDDQYKAQWMDTKTPLYQLQAYRLHQPAALLQFTLLRLKAGLRLLWRRGAALGRTRQHGN